MRTSADAPTIVKVTTSVAGTLKHLIAVLFAVLALVELMNALRVPTALGAPEPFVDYHSLLVFFLAAAMSLVCSLLAHVQSEPGD